jgi:hypothetical protein
VRVEVGVRRREGAAWRSREISFHAGDAEIERFKSVGFVVGTLARSEAPEPASARPEPTRAERGPESPPPVLAPAPSRPKERDPAPPGDAPPRGWVTISATGGRAVDRGGPRLGGNLRVGVRLSTHFSALVSAGASSRARTDQGLLVSFMDAGVGLGYILGNPASSRAELRAEVVLEHLTAEARSETDVDTNAHTKAGARAGVDGVLQITEVIAVVAGVEALGRSTTTEFKILSESAGSTTRVDFGALLGARLDL